MVYKDNLQKILDLAEDGLVLEVGGWADPFPRADYVLDIFPYETRSLCYQGIGKVPSGTVYNEPLPGEKFTRSTWMLHDLEQNKPFPFPDNKFDFVICSHTLEDINNSVFVCSELNRVAKAGYLETPSRLSEQTKGYDGGIGAPHHKWIIDYGDDELSFCNKSSSLASEQGCWIPTNYTHRQLPEKWVDFTFWEGSFKFEEVPESLARKRAREFVENRRIPLYYYLRVLLGKFKFGILKRFPSKTVEGSQNQLMTQEELNRVTSQILGK